MAKRTQLTESTEPAPPRLHRFTTYPNGAIGVEWLGEEYPTKEEIAACASFAPGDTVLVPCEGKCYPALITRLGARLIAATPRAIYAPKYHLSIEPTSPLALFMGGGVLESELLEHNRPTFPEKAMNLMLSTWREKHLRKGQKA